MKNKLFRLLLVLFMAAIHSANAQAVDSADALRANGKIYVVVGVILTIFVGIILFLIRIDRNISKLEKTIEEKQN
ncbi:MAG: CcmD family protein [Cytophagales bacterium]|nr:CcmD family protein [Cytophagales bacterium]